MLRVAELAIRHRVVENVPARAHQMPRGLVVDRAVVAEEMKEAAARIEHVRRVKLQRVLHMREQEVAAAKAVDGRRRDGAVGGVKRIGLRHGVFTKVLARAMRWTGK